MTNLTFMDGVWFGLGKAIIEFVFALSISIILVIFYFLLLRYLEPKK